MASELLSGTMILLMMMSMQGAEAAPLDDYVHRPDPFYSWTTLNWSSRGPTYTLFAINMTSQMWLTGGFYFFPSIFTLSVRNRYSGNYYHLSNK